MVERTYTIPLRRQWLKAPRYKRAKRAISAIRTFLTRHMKSEDIRIGTSVNLVIWQDGIKRPPGKVKVVVSKDDKGVVRAEIFGAPKPAPKPDGKKGAVKKISEKVIGEPTKSPPVAPPTNTATAKPETPKQPPSSPAKKPQQTLTPAPEQKPTPAKNPTAKPVVK